jgi:hypothetical protein
VDQLQKINTGANSGTKLGGDGFGMEGVDRGEGLDYVSDESDLEEDDDDDQMSGYVQSVSESTGGAINQLTDQLINRRTNYSTDGSINQPMDHLIDQRTNQSTDKAINRRTNTLLRIQRATCGGVVGDY